MGSKHFVIQGLVQGVGFRYFVVRQARALGLRGWVRNRRDGTVEAVAAGPESALNDLEHSLREGPSRSDVERVSMTTTEDPEQVSFEILPTT